MKTFSSKIKVRLSKELALKYDNGSYFNGLKNIQNCLDLIDTLGINYPGNAHPIVYIYIVPDDNYSNLLIFPKTFDKGNGGEKPVPCYDLDGFNNAYGTSQNLLENEPKKLPIAKFINEIHELSHIVHSQFFQKIKQFVKDLQKHYHYMP